MTISRLPALPPMPGGNPDLGDVTGPQEPARQIATGQAWTPELANLVKTLFDKQAADWNTGHSVSHFDPLHDALARGGIPAGGVSAEIGSGTGHLPRR
ncbi:hypothetical protein ACFWYW_18155 [Nonomuraea sp. NPDC059023]|uniref:hypothetical protein n=1 Tax=unclassified Nonomuraea TaxID=2593643 RepID=UPI00367926D9